MTCPFYIQCCSYGKIVEILFYCNWLELPKHFITSIREEDRLKALSFDK